MICKRCVVVGRVQGVFFRASTQRQARQLGVTGVARNLPDGSVEVIACGPVAAVDALIVWLHRGPELARVAGVTVTDSDGPVAPDFTID
jgi:acylphosphatase